MNVLHPQISSELPTHHRALVLEDVNLGFSVKQVSTLRPESGSAIICIDMPGTISYHRELYNGNRHYAFPKPLVGGSSAIGRVAALEPDAVAPKLDQLVYVDCVIRGRDDPDTLFLSAIDEDSTSGSKKLMHEDPGYSLQDLMYICYLLVPYGGLRDIKLEPGETMPFVQQLVASEVPTLQVALAMGARVIAMGKNAKESARLKEHVRRGSSAASIETVKMIGEEDTDAVALKTFGIVDAVLDFSLPAAKQSTHLRSAMTWSCDVVGG